VFWDPIKNRVSPRSALLEALYLEALLYSEAELRVLSVQQKRSIILVLTVAKNVNFKFSGDEFFMMSISKIMVPF
jgi:hypothetical protein